MARACPNCGDQHHLYDRADVRWWPLREVWEISHQEGTVDCTECDWTGSLAETERKES